MLSTEDIALTMGIEMPSDHGAERAVLGSILLDGECLDLVRDTLQGGEFDNVSHRRIYRAMLRVFESGDPVDMVSVTSQLQDSKELQGVGGPFYLSNLATGVPVTASAGYYAERVREMFQRREAIYTAAELLKQAAQQEDVKGFVAMAETAVSKLSDQSTTTKEFRSIRNVLMEVWDQAEDRYANRNINRGVTGIPSGYVDLDRMTSGFQKGDFIIVAARPSVGKTAFALNVAQNVGVRVRNKVAVFSLEMSASQLVQRMVCAEGHIEASRMTTGFFAGDDWERMTMAVSALSEADIHIDDTPGISVSEIRSKCRRLKQGNGLDMILIDYLQLIQGRGHGTNRQEEVSQISRTLKQLARELGVPVIALSQLSRGVEQRQDKRPMMSDLRESGAIEQDADIVAFLYRDDYYDKESEKKNIIEIIISKQRNGPVGTVELAFLKHYNKFISLDRTHQEGVKKHEDSDSQECAAGSLAASG